MASQPVMDHVERARRRREIAKALRAGMLRSEACRRWDVSYATIMRIVADFDLPRARRGRRLAAWPECPDHLRDQFSALCQRMPARSARAKLEGSAHVG